MYHGARSGMGFIAGGISDRFGIKWPLGAGIILYTIAVGLISLQDSLNPIVLLRIPQGIGVAILFTLAPALVSRAVGQDHKGLALGVTLGSMGLGTLAGTLVGGYLGQEIGWPAIFWARIPISIALLLTLVFALNGTLAKPVENRETQSFDLYGSIVLFATLFIFVLSVSLARVEGWLSPLPITLFWVTIILGWLFSIARKRKQFTILPDGLSSFPGFKSGALSNLLLTIASFVMWFLFPFYVADVMGRSVFTLGALLALMAGMNFAGAAIAGWLSDQIGDRTVTFTGAVITSIGLVFIGSGGANPTMTYILTATTVIGLGFGIHQAAVYALTLRKVPSQHSGVTSAALTVSQTIGTVISIAIMTSIINWRLSIPETSFVEAYKFAHFIVALVAIIAGLIVIKPKTGRV
mgnify:FL=1|tara:strand:- start:346 stop:1572 length:1227 start_codon:yes stop_codon:yes gene_type:complete